MFDLAKELRDLADAIEKDEIAVESYEIVNGIVEITTGEDRWIEYQETGEINIYLTLRK